MHMKKHGKKLTKRLTAFLMSFVMVMSVMTITNPMEVQAEVWGGGSSITDPRYVQGSSWIIGNLQNWKYVSFSGNFSFDASSSISLYIDGVKQTYTESTKEGSDGQFRNCNTNGKLFYSYYDSSSRTYYLDEIKNYTITYKTYSGSTTSETYYKYYKRDTTPSATVYVKSNNSTYSLKNNTTETGYTYGWYTSQSGGTNITSISSISGTTTLYEQRNPNTYYVKYDVNLPSGSSSSSTQMDNQQFTYDDFTTNLSANTYEVEGYSFLGWSTNQNATTPEFTDGAVLNRNLTSTNGATVDLYAVWDAIPSTITLKAEDATYPGTKTIQEKYGTGYYLDKSYTKVMSTTANKILIPKKDGYDFNGYYTGQGGSGTQIIDANGYITGTYTANTELFAHWVDRSANYTIQYHANGGTPTGATTTQNRTYTVADDTFTLNPMSDMFEAPVSSTGQTCEFLGWSASPSSSIAEYTDQASVSDFTDVNSATIHLYAVWRSTLPTSIQNGSFETPAIGSWYSIMPDTTGFIAWKTTASDHKIELARPGKNVSAANSAYHTTTAVDGYQFAELCANQVGALYQTVSTFSGNTLNWGFSHKGRSGNDTMELWIGAPADVTAVLDYYTSHNNSVAGISGDLLEKYNTISDNGSRSYTDGNTQWKSYTGNYLVPDGQIETTFAFVSIAASGNKISYGNLLDHVYFTAEVPPKTQVFQYGATSGGSAVAEVNGIATSGNEAFVSVGSTFEIYPAAADGYTYNGGFVNGSYVSVDALPLRYTVSDADTNLKHITLLFSKDSTIIFDKEGGNYEDDEYDLKASGNNQYYTLKANPTKEGYSFNNWMIAGSDVILTEGNYIAYETIDGKTYINVYNDSNKGTRLYQCESELGINLIATYRITTFPSAKVKLDMNGGNLDGETSVIYGLDESDLSDSAASSDVIEYSALTLPTPVKDGYVFTGWKIDENTYHAGTEIKYEVSTTSGNGKVTIGTDAQSAITSDTTYTLLALWEISYIETDADVTLYGDKKNPSSQWYTGDVTMKPDTGYKIRKEGESQWKNELVITGEGITLVTYQLTDSNGYITTPKTKEIYIDKTLPTGEISVGSDDSNKWNAFLNAITFGIFFKETQDVTITAEDPDGGSGFDKIYYHKSTSQLTSEEVAAIAEGQWTEYEGTFSIDPDAKLVIYAKLTDRSGNATYISTDGLVLDKTPPVITGVTNDTKYCGKKTITVKDDYLDTITVNGTPVALAQDSYELSTSAASGEDFTIVATDQAVNSTTVNVKIYKEHNWPVTWTVTKPATATKEGKEEQVCDNCGQKKYRTIPATGSQEANPTNGHLTKDAEVAPDAPITTATLNNAKSEIISAAAIFTDSEKTAITTGGKEARIWLEISKTDENKISQADQTQIMNTAEQIMGENHPDITYFDADLFKQVDGGMIAPISEPGIYIEVTIQIPDALLNHDRVMLREYQIIRLHNGVVDVISDGIFNESTKEFTFKTDRFSTYAIAYTDTPRPGSTTGGGGGGGGSTVISVQITKITVTPENGTLTKKGETLSLTAKVVPTNATNKKVTWTSSDPKVATVDGNGKVTAVGDGTVTITAKTTNGKSASSMITVKIEQEEPDVGNIQMDTTYRKLRLRVPTSTKTTNVLKWTKQTGADGYVIYGNLCNSKGKTYKLVKQVTIKDNATTSWIDTKLASGTYYKYYIKAYKLVDGKKVWLAKSKVVHSTTTGGKYGNAKSVTVNKTSVSLAVGKTFTIKAEQIVKDLPIKKHQEIKFESSNNKVASVTSKGVIKAKKKGTCYIYVYAQNGMYKRIKVTVK